ncbi:MAG: TetR/AcrR family transcriptional regulator [Alphaproteobacteria bacterium]|nr:TetR/AcrR family transcriptional regulator [Alphaproteobacteria bacterium]
MALRSARAAATKARIRDAAVALHADRLFDFTLDEVARRAGVTVQTVLRIYGSKDALYLLMMDGAANRQRRDSPPGDVPAAVAALYDDYETIGDQVIQYLADELRNPTLAPKVELGRQAHRQWVETVFAPQLRARTGRARQDLRHALIVATDVYAWKLLRRDLKLDRRDIERVITQMISALT